MQLYGLELYTKIMKKTIKSKMAVFALVILAVSGFTSCTEQNSTGGYHQMHKTPPMSDDEMPTRR